MGANSCTISGHLGQDPAIRQAGQKKVANLRVAVSDGYGEQKKTHWLDVVAWEKQADFAERFLRKGDGVLVEGRLQTREFESGGQKRVVVEIVARNVEGLGGKGDAKGGAKGGLLGPSRGQEQPRRGQDEPLGPIDDSLPF